MRDKQLQIITYLMLGLLLVSCLISIMHNEIYQDGDWANAQWLGQDMVSLLLASPLLFMAQHQSVKYQNWKWKMVWSGVFFYFVYTYAFFMFAAKLTFLYLFHLPIFSLAVIGFVISVLDIFSTEFKISMKNTTLKWTIIGYTIFISIMISVLWLKDIFAHLTIPGHRSDVPGGEAPLIIYSLDLAIVIPLMLLAAFGYWQEKQYGYKLIGIMLVKSSTLGFALMAMSLTLYFLHQNSDTFLIILWSIIGLIGMILAILYFRILIIDRS